MEFSHFAIQSSVKEIEEMLFLDMVINPYSFVSPSAYDTAWLAMVQDPQQPARPMFKCCLNWVLNNQREDGCWGEYCDSHGIPTTDSLLAALACSIALKRWNVGSINVEKGLEFIHTNAKKLLGNIYDEDRNFPRWFAIMFPSMVELAHTVGLELVFTSLLQRTMMDIFHQRQQILESEELVDKYHYPLLSYLEALPSTYEINQEDIVKNLSSDGSLFQSPSATARAFMITGNKECLAYLQSLVQRCVNGVPHTYPLDEELMKICIVNQLQRSGLAEHFDQEIEEILAQVYRNYKNQESQAKPINLVADKLYKDSLAFRILRMHGYSVSPWSFCWFLNDQEIQDHIEKNHEHFSSVMLYVYRATDLMFPGECELEAARSFSRKLLEKYVQVGTRDQVDHVTSPNFQKMIKHELSLPWIARLDHLEHRMWIEENNSNVLWMGKAFFQRFLSLHDNKLKQLAKKNFEFRQSVYKHELEELKRWTKDCGLNEMGFGREKTAYCYFAVAASTSLPYDSVVRKIVTKRAVLITVADDFFDMEGSLDELKILTDAVQRWDAKGLSGHSKTIFTTLDNLVRDIAAEHLQQRGTDITDKLRDIWHETFVSWLTEAVWSKNGCIPSMDEYLETGMTSIAIHTLVLPASCFVNPCLPSHKLKPAQYETITKLVMVITRLLNDLQSYEKEQEEGKTNSVLLHLRENPDRGIEDSIAYVQEMLDRKKKEFLQHALMDGFTDLPKPCKRLHLSCFKVFQMFFNTSNCYDSETDILQDIQKAIYVPLTVQTLKPSKPKPLPLPLPLQYGSKKECPTISSHSAWPFIRNHRERVVTTLSVSKPPSVEAYKKMISPPKFTLSFI